MVNGQGEWLMINDEWSWKLCEGRGVKGEWSTVDVCCCHPRKRPSLFTFSRFDFNLIIPAFLNGTRSVKEKSLFITFFNINSIDLITET